MWKGWNSCKRSWIIQSKMINQLVEHPEKYFHHATLLNGIRVCPDERMVIQYLQAAMELLDIRE